MRIQYLGHSAVYIETGSHRLIIDPFIEGNALCPVPLEELLARDLTHVLITHAHGDHWGNALDFARRGAVVVGTAEIAGYAQQNGVQAHAMNIGGRWQFEWGSVRLTPAWHSSSFPDGTYGGMPTGMVLEVEGQRIYHAGDTARFSDMRLIGDLDLDLAFLPIGDNFTMGVHDAAESLHDLRPDLTVPVHYNTFPPIRTDPQEFVSAAELRGFAARVVQPGDWL
ncbi:L-ascorbate metabolism protein UlaG (beta-lactamase superfamily) [Deinobacterium chartae]|uniref:UPF0173 metal-dependent hydrolase HNR42_003569 n=1 Tax=Deinobacterium chartae TaxID=521158 RepID=A0A841I4Z3_9DEIO|nr:metal-dependent hydrolase [Deinobacterium chartae]MBB6100104.1 L-ascorbate metabolism protein UlaG (beta-lactamase superfamily) [Deinobacterium chartae]